MCSSSVIFSSHWILVLVRHRYWYSHTIDLYHWIMKKEYIRFFARHETRTVPCLRVILIVTACIPRGMHAKSYGASLTNDRSMYVFNFPLGILLDGGVRVEAMSSRST